MQFAISEKAEKRAVEAATYPQLRIRNHLPNVDQVWESVVNAIYRGEVVGGGEGAHGLQKLLGRD